MKTILVINKNGVYCACSNIPAAFYIAQRDVKSFDMMEVETFDGKRYQDNDEVVYVYGNEPFATDDEARQACFEAHPELLDDDMPDFFSNNIVEMTASEYIKFYNEGGKMK